MAKEDQFPSERFVADGMLGSLTRKLRVFGYDVLYDPSATDEEIISVGKESSRIILTCDRELHRIATARGVYCILLDSDDDEEDLKEVFLRVGIDNPSLHVSKCPVCNGQLREALGREVKGRVYPNVLKLHKTFYLCQSCGKVYWEGSHWEKLKRMMYRVRRSLERREDGKGDTGVEVKK